MVDMITTREFFEHDAEDIINNHQGIVIDGEGSKVICKD